MSKTAQMTTKELRQELAKREEKASPLLAQKQKLVNRLCVIDDELKAYDKLKAKKDEVQKELEPINAALKEIGFDDVEIKPVGQTALTKPKGTRGPRSNGLPAKVLEVLATKPNEEWRLSAILEALPGHGFEMSAKTHQNLAVTLSKMAKSGKVMKGSGRGLYSLPK